MIDEMELPEKPNGFDYELAEDVCKSIVRSLAAMSEATSEPSERQKLERQAQLYWREARRNHMGSDTAYQRTRLYHDQFAGQLAQQSQYVPAISAVRRPYKYARPTGQSVSPR